MDPVFSIICVWNDSQKLDLMTNESLQNADSSLYEAILINNQDQRFDSAAAALNHGANKATGEYYLFLHQDVQFRTKGWLSRMAEQIRGLDFGLAGITGVTPTREEGTHGRGQARHGADREFWGRGLTVSGPTRVQTVDEFCLLVPAETFDRRGFNESICSGWHLYGVEYSLYISQRTDKDVFVLPLDVWHGSTGMDLDEGYFSTLARVLQAYPEIDRCYTTCGYWPSSPLFARAFAAWMRLTDRLPSPWDRWASQGAVNKYNWIGWYFALREFESFREDFLSPSLD